MGRDCKREKRGKKNWDEISIKPNEYGELVRERRKENTVAR